MLRVDHRFTLSNPALVSAPSRKSFSSVSSPILACSAFRSTGDILRVADALDRSHFSVVKNIEVRYSPGRLIIGVDTNNEKADLELWTCERRADLLSRLLDRQVTLER